jgi:hypothetical protein
VHHEAEEKRASIVVLPRRCFQLPVITYREREREEKTNAHKENSGGCFTVLLYASKDANTISLARPKVGSPKSSIVSILRENPVTKRERERESSSHSIISHRDRERERDDMEVNNEIDLCAYEISDRSGKRSRHVPRHAIHNRMLERKKKKKEK